MPTGYTSRVLKGESFEDFALDTATAFSYLARSLSENGDMRGPLPDPETSLANSYHQEQLTRAQKSLKGVLKMSFARAARKAQKEYDGEKARVNKRLEEIAVDAYTLDQMVKKVLAYQPPDTEAHKAHKAYMLEQLAVTIKSDTDPKYYHDLLADLKLLTAQEWKANAVKEAKHDIEYHTEHLAKERANLQRDVDFIANLRTAVKPVPQPK